MFRTTSQTKKVCSNCPIAKASDLVGDSVVLIIVRDLMSGPKRFGDIHEALGGVSSRTVTQKLKRLEGQGIIDRVEFKSKPPHVEYSLTQKGKGLKKIVNALFEYGDNFL